MKRQSCVLRSFAPLSLSVGLAMGAPSLANGLREWTNRPVGVTNDLFAVTFGCDRFVAVGSDGIILVSTDGAQWQRADSPTLATLRGVTCAAGTLVAVGEGGTILTSVNAAEWVPRQSGSSGELFSVESGGGQFVAVGRLDTGSGYAGVVLTSTDGVDWTVRDSGVEDPLYAVAFGAGFHLAVGHLSAVASTNGIQWHRVAVPNYSPVYAIVYGRGLFVTAEDDVYTPRQAFSVSDDAVYWRHTTADTDGDAWGATFGTGVFAAVGGLTSSFDDPTNQIVVSADGEHWHSYPVGVVPELRGIAYGLGTFVAVGLSGTLVQSGTVTQSYLSIQATPNRSGVEITLQGDAGCVYRLQTSTNVAAAVWDDLLFVTNSTGTVAVTNVSTSILPQRFFRAVSQ